MQDVSDKLLQQFVACIERQFAEPEPETAARMPVARQPRPPPGPPRRPAPRGAAAARLAAAGPPPGPAAPRPLRPAARAGADDSIDLGATVLPVLVKNYAPYAVAALAGLVLGWLIGRRSS